MSAKLRHNCSGDHIAHDDLQKDPSTLTESPNPMGASRVTVPAMSVSGPAMEGNCRGDAPRLEGEVPELEVVPGSLGLGLAPWSLK